MLKSQRSSTVFAFVVIVAGIVQKYGYEGLCIATIMAGGILIIMGLARFGGMIKFIPYPVTTGFTSGIALLIFSTQIKDFLGLKIDAVPGDFPALSPSPERLRALDLVGCQSREREQCGPVRGPLARNVLGCLGRLPKWERAYKGG